MRLAIRDGCIPPPGNSVALSKCRWIDVRGFSARWKAENVLLLFSRRKRFPPSPFFCPCMLYCKWFSSILSSEVPRFREIIFFIWRRARAFMRLALMYKTLKPAHGITVIFRRCRRAAKCPRRTRCGRLSPRSQGAKRLAGKCSL